MPWRRPLRKMCSRSERSAQTNFPLRRRHCCRLTKALRRTAAGVGQQFGAAFPSSGQVAQVAYRLNRAMENGLTQMEAAEAISHLAYYVGWPNVFSAMPVAKDVFEKRSK